MKSFDVAIRYGDEEYPFTYGPRGGLALGNALKEPTERHRLGTITIQSLHHGAGRLLATDPSSYRDTNSQQIGADVRQPGYVMPGGELSFLGPGQSISGSPIPFPGYAAAFVTDDGIVAFCAGRDIFSVSPLGGDVIEVRGTLNSNNYFTGSFLRWREEIWLGIMDRDQATQSIYEYISGVLNTDENRIFSWAASTRNAAFWISNVSGNDPKMRWSDRTDQNFLDITLPDPDADPPDPGFVYGPFTLEVPGKLVTGMGAAGSYPMFATAGGNLWGFDPFEVFIPLTPDKVVAFRDRFFGGQMPYAGAWLMVPSSLGLLRFDPRSATITDITPATHQGASPDFTDTTSRRVDCVCTSPTGALVFTHFGDGLAVLYLESYEEGMFYHVAVSGLDVAKVWGAVVVQLRDASGNPTGQQSCYFLAESNSHDTWLFYRLDLPTAGWQPGPQIMASTSGVRTSMYSANPPDISVRPTQLRGYANASEDNYLSLTLEVDGTAYDLGRINTPGPFALPITGIDLSEVTPGRKFAIGADFAIDSQVGEVPYLALPLHLDYVSAPVSAGEPDLVTIKITNDSDGLDLLGGRRFTNGRDETEFLAGLEGQIAELKFGDRDVTWKILVERVESQLATQDEGVVGTTYLTTIVARRIQ